MYKFIPTCFYLEIIELAMKNSITLFKFPSHLTDILQPLDNLFIWEDNDWIEIKKTNFFRNYS